MTTIDLASDINDYLTCQKSRVLATSYPASSIDDLKILIISHIDQNHDIQIEHYTHHIYPDNNGIHDCLIESYDDDGVIFVDPWARRQSRYFVSWNQLENSLDISNGREC